MVKRKTARKTQKRAPQRKAPKKRVTRKKPSTISKSSNNKFQTSIGFLLNVISPGIGTLANNEITKGTIQIGTSIVGAIIAIIGLVFGGFLFSKEVPISEYTLQITEVAIAGLALIVLMWLWSVIDYLIKLVKANKRDKTFDKRMSIIGLIINIIIPGMGTFIGGENLKALRQLVVYLISIIILGIGTVLLLKNLENLTITIISVIGIIIATSVLIITWVWSILTSVTQIKTGKTVKSLTNFDVITGLYLNLMSPGIGTITNNNTQIGVVQYIFSIISCTFLGPIVALWAIVYSLIKISKQKIKPTKNWAVLGLIENIRAPGIGTIIIGKPLIGTISLLVFYSTLALGISALILEVIPIYVAAVFVIPLAVWIFGITISSLQLKKVR